MCGRSQSPAQSPHSRVAQQQWLANTVGSPRDAELEEMHVSVMHARSELVETKKVCDDLEAYWCKMARQKGYQVVQFPSGGCPLSPEEVIPPDRSSNLDTEM